MTGIDKKTVYNLLKAAGALAYGYTKNAFKVDNPEFYDDCEPAASCQSLPADENKVSEIIVPKESSQDQTSVSQNPNDNDAVDNELYDADRKKGASLDLLSRRIFDCTRCELSKNKTNVVPGAGVLSPSVIVIGKAPSVEDDKKGIPFSDEPGILLDKMLEAISLSKNQNVFITNIVKCRPPLNRNPQLSEVGACISFLEAQISILKPKMILTLGESATSAVLRTRKPFSELHGNFYDFQGIAVMGIYHPEEIQNNPALKPQVWKELKAFKARLKELCPDYDCSFRKES